MGVVFSNLALGFHQILTVTNIMWIIVGGLLGTIMGMLPGLGPATGVAVLIPITFGMHPVTALATMFAIYYGAMFGGSRASIMINTPGDSSAIVTCFDGYPMTKNGEAGKALAISAIASFVGGCIGSVFLIFLTMPVANAALKFGPAEMFSLMLFALTCTITLSQGSLLKGCISMCIGFLISFMGIDPQTGINRFTFGIDSLQDGVNFLVAMIGLYAIAEVFKNYKDINTQYKVDSKNIGKVMIDKKDFKKCLPIMLRDSPIGFLVGVLPGMGGTMATFMTYALEKSLSKHPEKFGKGAIEGVAAPESANNACSCGAMVPLLTLGIPGSGTTAVMLGALTMLGVKPGPVLFQQHPEVAWGVIASLLIGNIILVCINLPLVIPLVQLLRIPQRLMLPLILGLGYMGTYLMNYNTFDFVLVTLFGLGGYLFSKLDMPIPPLVLALILGSTTEQNFRNAMSISNGSMSIFVTKPISLILLLCAAFSLVFSIYKEKKNVKKNSAAA